MSGDHTVHLNKYDWTNIYTAVNVKNKLNKYVWSVSLDIGKFTACIDAGLHVFFFQQRLTWTQASSWWIRVA